jgi:hypothetical protein
MPSLIPEAVPAAAAYQTVQTQWRRAGMTGVRVGLDYAACLPVLRLQRDRWTADGVECAISEAELLEDVQVVEMAILEVDQERADAREGGAA